MRPDLLFQRYKWLFFIIIPVTSILLHWKVFSLDIVGTHAIRQAQTQQNILNFYREDPNILNPRTFVVQRDQTLTILRYEFPIMQWSIAMSYHVTGASILTTRIIMFLIGLFGVGGMYFLLRQFFTEFIAWGGAFMFSLSPVYFCYMVNPMPDVLALSSTLWSLGYFFLYLKSGRIAHVVWSAFFISLGIAAKLPYILFLSIPGFWWLTEWMRKNHRPPGVMIRIALLYILILLPTFIWYAWVMPSWSNGVISGMLENSLSSERAWEIFHYHLTEMFPKRLLGQSSLVLLFAGIFFIFRKRKWTDMRFWLLALMGFITLFYWAYEFNMIETVHDYYMMPFLPALFILATFGFQYVYQVKKIGPWIACILLALTPYITYDLTRHDWDVERTFFLKDAFKYGEDLKHAAPQDAICILVNDPSQYVFAYLVDKKGFVFRDDNLPAGWIEDMILNYNATYMYSDTRKIDEDPSIRQYFEQMVMERGNIKVFKLAVKK